MLKNFTSALEFFTIIPVKSRGEFNPVAMAPWFPMVGLCIGFMTGLLDQVLLLFWPQNVAAILDVVFLVAITGALHLDGVADTADGLYGQRPVEKALSIMKDSRVGAMGLVAVVCCLAVKWGAINAVSSQRFLCLMLVPAFARSSVLLGMRALPYGRPDGGTGAEFFREPLKTSDFMSFLIPAGLSLILGFKGIVLIFGFIIVNGVILMYYKKKINCITGDMLGAMIEINEAALFLIVAGGGRL